MMYIIYSIFSLKKTSKIEKHVLRTVWYSILGMQKSSHVTGAADSKSQVPAVIGLNEEVHCTFCDFFCGGFDQQKG
jgi:hypothetical protein